MSDTDKNRPGHRSGLLHVVVLGGYGLIGSAVMRRLAEAGHRVTGVGRSAEAADRSPFDTWKIFDIGTMSVEGWREALADADAVVNASGALQDGARDDLTAIHETALVRLAEALRESETRLVQISAAGVAENASTEFYRSKARGEAALKDAQLDCVILRPTLVIAPTAYGGTALLRAAAAIPVVLPKVLSDTRIACVHVDDLALAVLDAVEGKLPSGTDVEVTGAGVRSVPELLRDTRRWLGFAKARLEVPVPDWMLNLISRFADLTGHFGWRSPLRTSAVRVLKDGVVGDPDALPGAGGTPCRPMDEVFASLPATTQDRWFARAFLVYPLGVLCLSVFWVLSGLIGLLEFNEAREVLTSRGTSAAFASLAVAGGGFADIALGLAVLWKRCVKWACLGMVALSLVYLAGAAVFAPDLWVDPLGPMVKVLPGIVLALFVLSLSEDR